MHDEKGDDDRRDDVLRIVERRLERAHRIAEEYPIEHADDDDSDDEQDDDEVEDEDEDDSEDEDKETPVRALITADLAGALPGLGRKIPHYHKYSYLGFAGEEPENVLRGRWPVTGSPMSVAIETGAAPGRLEKTPTPAIRREK